MISKVREQWQQHIIDVIKTIDEHSQCYLRTGDQFHKTQHDYLVEYVHRIKTWIKDCEADTEGSNNVS